MSFFKKTVLISLVACLSAISCLQSQNETDVTVIKGATVFDGNGSSIADGVIVTKDGIIDCIGEKSGCSIPNNSKVIDAKGKFITPGLVDAHMHFFQTAFFDSRPDAMDINSVYPISEVIAYQRRNPQRYYDSYLCSGVTAVYDVGGMSWSIDLQKQAENNPKAPHVAAAGPLLTPVPGAPFDLPSDKVLVHLNSKEAGVKTVQYLSDLGSTGIKFWQIRANDPEYMSYIEAAAEEIEKKGNMMIAHATTLEQAKAALRNGTKLLVHSVENTDVDEEFIELALQNETYYNPTLIVGSGYTLARRAAADIEAFEIVDPNGCVDQKTRTLLETASQFKDHPRMTENVKSRLMEFDSETDRVSEQQLRNLKRLHDSGVKVVVGTDAGNPGTLHGVSIYDEMEAMQSAGISPEDMIVIATKNGAESMRRGDDFGTLEKGKFANLIILNSDPSQDISNMRSITHTMIKGTLMKVDEIVEK
ncbi:MAG: amidohydrolase family protein [Balneola sp.]|nr:amidohydrolase family protein [Balneola sp.]MBO6651237.1 amidohydrolase family protein [Balneola sp.]MBO6712032.1 amidohydrolase family protein [Balneola sp.]MBO6800226.1 amidohydrolase family protein [Balneola sp.]MBO6869760.1 amidohydrolase family protein [Balneola sp.]